MKRFLALTLLLVSTLASGQDLHLVIPRGHTGTVTQISVSHDNKYAISTDGTNEIVVWDYEAAREMTRLAFTNNITALTIQGQNGLIGLRDGKLLALKLDNFQTTPIYDAKGTISTIITHATDAFIASRNGKVLRFDSNHLLLDSLQLGDEITTINLTTSQYYIGTANGHIKLIDRVTKKVTQDIAAGESAINFIGFSPKTSRLVAADNRGQLFVSLIGDPASLKTYDFFTLRCRDMFFESDSSVLAVGRDDYSNIKRMNINNGKIEIPAIWEDQKQYPSFPLGLYTILGMSNREFLVSGYQENFLRVHSLGNKTNYIGEAGVLNMIAVDSSGTKLAIAFAHNEVQVLDLTGGRDPRLFSLEAAPTSLDWQGTTLFAGLSNGNLARLTGDSVSILNPGMPADYTTTPIRISIQNQLYTRKYSREVLDVFNLRTLEKTKTLKKAGFAYAFHPISGDLFFVNAKKKLERWSTGIKFKRRLVYPISDAVEFQFIKQGNELVVLGSSKIYIVDTRSNQVTADIPLHGLVGDHLFASPDGNQLYLTHAARVKGSTATNYYAQAIDGKTGQELFKLEGHSAIINDIEFIKNGKFILTASRDGTIRMWNRKGNFLGHLVPLKGGQQTVVGASGLFDASTGAMDKLSYLQGNEVITLEQIKSKYYEPALLSKILGFNAEATRNSKPLTHVKVYPEFELVHPMHNNGKLGINITSREGGAGRVIILINGKEVNNDMKAGESNHLEFDIANHPYVLTGDLNKISVKIYNKDGDAVSRPRNLFYLDKQKPEDVKPHLYGLVVGVSDYRGDNLDLKYAAHDADAMAAAVELSAKDYLGKENVHIRSLNTLKDSMSQDWPSKKNIIAALDDIASKAKARDILFLYLSGHGEVDKEDQGEFFYLTSDAGNGNIADSIFRKKALISNFEMVEELQKIPALKQVLVVDACHSGSLVSSLSGTSPTMSSAQVRSFENLKDRANIYILAGSAADAVSYESSIYGQGLLTYSMLMGMKGPALRNNQFVDILQLFNFASAEVPELASEIGGIQKPEIKIPATGSFDIGKLNDEQKDLIKVNSPKPIFIYSSFQDEAAFLDVLNLGRIVDAELRALDARSDAQIVFLNTNSYHDAFSIKGRYSMDKSHLIHARVRLFKDKSLILSFETKGQNTGEVKDKIIDEVLKNLQPILTEQN